MPLHDLTLMSWVQGRLEDIDDLERERGREREGEI